MLRVKVLQVNGNNVLITDGSKQMSVTRQQLDSKIKDGAITVDAMKVKCLDKQRDKNNAITAYLLCDESGKQMAVKPEQLKAAMYNYQVDCINLTLTSDNRLIDKEEKTVANVKAAQPAKAVQTPKSDSLVDALGNQYTTCEEIVMAVYMQLLKAEISKLNILHRESATFNALVSLLKYCNTDKKLASAVNQLGIKPIVYECSEYDDCGGIDNKLPDLKLGYDISNLVELLFDSKNAYLFMNEPFNVEEYIYNIGGLDTIDKLRKANGISTGGYMGSSEVIVVPEWVYKEMHNEAYMEIERSVNYYEYIIELGRSGRARANDYKDALTKLEETKKELAKFKDIRLQYNSYIQSNDILPDYSQRITKKRGINREFVCYTYYNGNIYILIEENVTQIIDKHGNVNNMKTYYVLYNAKSLQIISANLCTNYTDYD